MKFFPITRQRLNTLLYYILCISILLFTSACGDTDHSSSEIGSISFSIEWRVAPTIKDASGFAITRALDCVASGVVSVEAHIFDENGSYLTAGGPWLCSAHAGTIENVPEGLNRRVVVSGKDSNDNLLYSGEVTGITVTTGQTTNAGTIVVNPVNTAPISPTNVSATAGDGQVTISWDSVSGATSYNIYWATWSGVSKTSYEGITSPDTSINPDTTVFESVLSYNGNTYALTKDDILTWEEADTLSNQHDGYIATINDAQENAFLTQNYLSLIYKEFWIGYNDRNNEGTWVWANGETSTYTNWGPGELIGDEDCVIIRDTEGYWNEMDCTWGRSAIVEWETETSYTHTSLTNGTTYYYVVTAVNDYGESDESNEVSAMPNGTDSKLPDTGQIQSYTSTFGEDSDYEINLPSYTDNGNGTITDNVTSLMWQKEDDNTKRIWDDAISYCNNLTFAEYSDWRLPVKKELMSIVDYGTYSPSIDTTYFTGTNTLDYWSSTSRPSSPGAWTVAFGRGNIYGANKSLDYYVRCIRGQELSFGNFTDNGNGTVTDNGTGLMWQQGEGGSKTWEDAIMYCEGLSSAGYTDWRLPNIKELESITDDNISNPTIDTNFFFDANASGYWSSTTDIDNYPSSFAWCVDFNSGFVISTNYVKTESHYVRCVRGGQ